MLLEQADALRQLQFGSGLIDLVSHNKSFPASWQCRPTCGFPEPIMMNLAGWTMLMPSLSTVLTPLAALSSTTSTRPSSSRLTSSTYRMPLLALACRQDAVGSK